MKTIAIVEDNEDNRLLVEAILEDHYETLCFADGRDAIASLEHAPPDLILLDISLPGMDGIEVLQELRARESTKAIPTIALTAHAMTGDAEKFLEAGFDAYVSKPIVDESSLLGTIARLITGS